MVIRSITGVESATVPANGARLYYEVRGNGPSVLFVQGATGDGGTFSDVADLLADEFRVITYDRRGNSRSPRPEGWTTTSIGEQSDDAAALIDALALAPTAVFGTSGGGMIVMELVVRHPAKLRGAIVHEPPLRSVLEDPEGSGAELQAMAEEGMAKGGPQGAMEAFLRHNAGEATFENLDPSLRQRVLANAEVFFTVEKNAFVSYLPDAGALSKTQVPVVVAVGAESYYPELTETSKWVAARVGTEPVVLPGAHAGYMSHPKETAEALRRLLRPFAKER